MAQWYYSHDGQKLGPVRTRDLKQLAANGELLPDDLIWQEGMTKWVRARKLTGLFQEASGTPPPVPPNAPNATSSAFVSQVTEPAARPAEGAPLGRLRRWISRTAGTVKRASILAAKHAQLKASTWNLNRADEAVGSKAFAGRIGDDSFPDLFGRIDRLNEEIETKRAIHPAPEVESVSAKAKRIALDAQTRLAVERLLSERHKYMCELGQRLRASSELSCHRELADDLLRAHNAQVEVDRINAEIIVLSGSQRPRLRKLVVGTAIAVILVVGYGFYHVFTKPHSTAAPSQALSDIASHARSESERLQTELADIRHKREKEASEEDARQKHEAEKSAVESERLRAAAEKSAHEAEIARRKQVDVQRREAELKAIAAQGDRKRLAEQLFGSMQLNPETSACLSRTLKQQNATIELRGPNSAKIIELQRNRDWLGLINLIDKQSYTEYPIASAIEECYKNLLRQDFQLFVKTPDSFTPPCAGDEPIGHSKTVRNHC